MKHRLPSSSRVSAPSIFPDTDEREQVVIGLEYLLRIARSHHDKTAAAKYDSSTPARAAVDGTCQIRMKDESEKKMQAGKRARCARVPYIFLPGKN